MHKTDFFQTMKTEGGIMQNTQWKDSVISKPGQLFNKKNFRIEILFQYYLLYHLYTHVKTSD